MGRKIITTHSNGAKNIDLSRQETNKDNLLEGQLLWKEIVEIDEQIEDEIAKGVLPDPNQQMLEFEQTVDELVQRDMLNEELPNWVFKKCKPVTYVYDGKLLDKKTYLELDRQRTRKDIDTLGESENKNIWIFQKYAKVAGGHQDNVLTETKHFLIDAAMYSSDNNDHNYFIAQLDGKFIESHIKDLNNNIKGSSKVYAGNTEQVIDWIKNI